MITSNYPVAHQVVTKIAKIDRTDTSAKELFQIPAGALVLDIKVFVGVASDAGTTATISIGDGSSATKYLNAQSVKTAGAVRPSTTVANMFSQVALGYENIYGVYAETGTASTTGGSFYVAIEYLHLGPGEIIN